MKKKKAGFTLLEIIIVMTISIMVISIVHLVFLTGLNVFNDTNVKSDIQIEGQQVQQEISNKLMSAKQIRKIETKTGTIDFDDDGNSDNFDSIRNNWIEINSITLDVAQLSESEDSEEDDTKNDGININTYTFKVDGKNLLVSEDGDSSGKILTTNIYDKDDKPQFSIKVSDSSSAQFRVNLRKKRGKTDVEYPINVDVLFRNSDIE